MQSVGVLALQGSFSEHLTKLAQLTEVLPVAVKTAADLEQVDRLILPGGESTAISRLLQRTGLSELLKRRVKEGLPVWGTCAGLILLAKEVANDARRCFCTLPVTVQRNAYGRQLSSFHTVAPFAGLGDIPMTFIRAPYIAAVEDGVEVLSTVEERIVAVRYQNQTAVAFHPELDADLRIHEQFLHQCQ